MIKVACLAFKDFDRLVAKANQDEVHVLKLKHEQVLYVEDNLWYLGLALVGLLCDDHRLQGLLSYQLGLE